MEKHVLFVAGEEVCLNCAAGLCTLEEGIVSANVCGDKGGKKNIQAERAGEGEGEVCPCVNRAVSFMPALCCGSLTSWK